MIYVTFYECSKYNKFKGNIYVINFVSIFIFFVFVRGVGSFSSYILMCSFFSSSLSFWTSILYALLLYIFPSTSSYAFSFSSSKSRNKVFVFKISVDLPGSDVHILKYIQMGGDMENSWIMFDHVKRLKYWTTFHYKKKRLLSSRVSAEFC